MALRTGPYGPSSPVEGEESGTPAWPFGPSACVGGEEFSARGQFSSIIIQTRSCCQFCGRPVTPLL